MGRSKSVEPKFGCCRMVREGRALVLLCTDPLSAVTDPTCQCPRHMPLLTNEPPSGC